jgi:hypothetical protein
MNRFELLFILLGSLAINMYLVVLINFSISTFCLMKHAGYQCVVEESDIGRSNGFNYYYFYY